LCEKFAEIFTNGDLLTITSKEGTNFTTSLKGRKGNAHKCLVEKAGQFSAAPNIEANFSPVEKTSSGVFVADASIPYLGIGALSSPVTFVIKDGVVVEVRGGARRKRSKNLARKSDPNVQYRPGPWIEPGSARGHWNTRNYDEGAFERCTLNWYQHQPRYFSQASTISIRDAPSDLMVTARLIRRHRLLKWK
jgi:hypothetical protein